MSLENEMKREIKDLERDIDSINNELEMLKKRVINLVKEKQKKQKDLRVLKNHFEPEEEIKKEMQTTLGSI